MKNKLIATLLLAAHLAGCYSMRTTTISPTEIIADEQPSTVRVTLTDGTQLTLEDPTTRNDSISGFVSISAAGTIELADGRRMTVTDPTTETVFSTVALSDVRSLEVRSFSEGKTWALVLGVPVGLLGVLVGLGAIACRTTQNCFQ